MVTDLGTGRLRINPPGLERRGTTNKTFGLAQRAFCVTFLNSCGSPPMAVKTGGRWLPLVQD